MDYCAALCMMIMASIFLSGLGWVVLQASFVGWAGLGWVGSQKMDPRPCLLLSTRLSAEYPAIDRCLLELVLSTDGGPSSGVSRCKSVYDTETPLKGLNYVFTIHICLWQKRVHRRCR